MQYWIGWHKRFWQNTLQQCYGIGGRRNYENQTVFTIGGNIEMHQFEEENTIKNMYCNLRDAILSENTSLYCPVENTRNFVLVSNGAFESAGGIHEIRSEFISRESEEDSVATYINSISAFLVKASEQKMLLAETGVKWAVKGNPFSVAGYHKFDMFR